MCLRKYCIWPDNVNEEVQNTSFSSGQSKIGDIAAFICCSKQMCMCFSTTHKSLASLITMWRKGTGLYIKPSRPGVWMSKGIRKSTVVRRRFHARVLLNQVIKFWDDMSRSRFIALLSDELYRLRICM